VGGVHDETEAIEKSTLATNRPPIFCCLSSALKSFGWEHLHFEHHHQPQFDTPEHEANWHVIAYCWIAVS